MANDRVSGETNDDLPEWLHDDVSSPEEPVEPRPAGEQSEAEALPDWLTGGERVEASAPAEEPPASEEEEALPDWLTRAEPVEMSAPAEEPAGMTFDEWQAQQEAAARPDELAEALPDWFEKLDEGVPEPPLGPVESQLAPEWFMGLEEQPEEAAPDWLKQVDLSGEGDLAGDAGGLADKLLGGEPAPEAGPIPDWFRDMEAPAEEAAMSEPDRMAGSGVPIEAAAPAEEAAPPVEGEVPVGLPPLEGADWLSAVGPAPAESAEAEPSWMDIIGSDLVSEPAPEAPIAESEVVQAALEGEMPDWLAQMQPEGLDALAREGEAPPGEEEALAPAEELPGWLEAARPTDRFERWGITAPEGPLPPIPEWAEALSPFALDMALDAKEAQREESSGPLAGLKGTLVAEPIMSMPGAPALVTQLVVTDQDARQARLLEEMTVGLFEEKEEEARPSPARRPRIPLGRLLISVVLLVGLVLPFFVDADQNAALPEVPGPVSDAIEQIDGLEQGEVVLVAFEYGAAEAGELDPAARAVLQHVVAQGARIVTLTTNPAGMMIGHRLVGEVTEGTDVEAVDLGYLAGFLGGLRSLVGRDADPQAGPPARFAIDFRGEGTDLNVSSMRERFRLILVLTGQDNALRAWLEQIDSVTGREDESLLGEPVPMVAVVGAGIEPIAAAYRESGQLEGYVAGYAGARAYAPESGQQSPVRSAEGGNSITAGVTIAAAVILLGNLGYLLLGLVRRRRR
jgi:hypothetical protein